jgi:3-oxoacyl-[acyl-carrier-protein] synthase II
MDKAVQRVAITGVGMITPLGVGVPASWEAMLQGRSGIRLIRRFDVSDCTTKIGGELPDEYYALEEREFNKRKQKQTQQTTRLGFLCAKEAVRDSGFSLAELDLDPYRCGVITGAGQAGYEGYETDEELVAVWRNPPKFVIIQQMPNALSGWVTIEYGMKGRSFNVSTACASGAFAIANAYEYIASGRGDAAVAIGVDTLLTSLSIKGFNNLMAMSTRNDAPERAMRPFDSHRDGFVLANGGAALMLEAEPLARKRGARIYAYISGVSMLSEAFNIVAPQGAGEEMARTMLMALKDARKNPEDVDYVSAHGTSTQQNDADETSAIKMAFGDHARKLAISSQKSMTGHTVGGAGAIECVATALCLYHGVLTPTINYESPAPECDLDYVPNQAREARHVRVAISNSFGFGGHNSTLVLEKA